MRKGRILALVLSLGLTVVGSVPAYAVDVSKMAFMSCSRGDRLEISLDNTSVGWSSSDGNVAVVGQDGVVSIVGEGNCDLTDPVSGFVVKVRSSGESSQTGVLELNYSSNADSLKSTVYKDSTLDVQTVEVNETVAVDSSSVPSGFQAEGSSSRDVIVSDPSTSNVLEMVSATAESGGIFTSQDISGNTVVVRVIDPRINQYAYYGSVGNTIQIALSDTAHDTITYLSENTDVATVSEDGLVSLVGDGETTIVVSTGANERRCKIVSVKPMIDTSDVILKSGETSQIEVLNNFANLPVSYSVISGDGSVSDSGVVSVDSGKVVVRVLIGDFAYDKEFSIRPTYYYANPAHPVSLATDASHAEYWSAMQPFIEECLGTPYVWGGEVPGVGLDCSGYVSYVYRSVGLISGRMDAQGLYDICTKTSNPQPGDLVFFQGTYDTPGISHVGIYAGDGMMYHSGKPNKLSSFTSSYWQSRLVGYGTLVSSENSADYSVEGYSTEQMELMWAIVAQEDSTGYEGALAVISSAMNRADIDYMGYGSDPLSQLTAPGQYCYSSEVSDPSLWQARLGGNVDEFVKQAVSDCLSSGLRNHEYLHFRSTAEEGRVQIGENWYFN